MFYILYIKIGANGFFFYIAKWSTGYFCFTPTISDRRVRQQFILQASRMEKL